MKKIILIAVILTMVSFSFAIISENIGSKAPNLVAADVYVTENHTDMFSYDASALSIRNPDIVISELVWNFSNVAVGESVYKDLSITNVGGSNATISSIEISGSVAFALSNMPTLPAILGTNDTINFRVNFAPETMGQHVANVIITDSQNSHQIAVLGFGIEGLTVGAGDLNSRVPFDFYYKNSITQIVYTSEDLGGFFGYISGIKLYNNFAMEAMNQPIKIWMADTHLTDVSGGWVSSENMTLVYDGIADFPAGLNTITISFIEPFFFFEHGNILLLFNRPMDNTYYSGQNLFRCQNMGSNRVRYDANDTLEFYPDAMSGGQLVERSPMITFEVFSGGVGGVDGVVRGEDGSLLAQVEISIDDEVVVTTDQNGEFRIANLLPGDYQMGLARYGYYDHFEDISIEENVMMEMDIALQEIPKVSILGSVIASDNGAGIEGANLTIVGYINGNATTNAAGEFIIESGLYIDRSYEYYLTASGYTAQNGVIEMGAQDYDMGVITMEELAYAPIGVEAEISPDHSEVSISWLAPDPNAFEIAESFEDAAFPPANWAQEITNTGVPNMYGVYPTWCRFSTADGVFPSSGAYQAGMAWEVEPQNEWLFSPTFSCPPGAYLRFDTHLEMGSDGGDHYYVKISSDGGASWHILWDGATEPAGMNNYAEPILIDLSPYSGQTVKLAWHAYDGGSNLGMYYNWYIDNVYISNFTREAELGKSAASSKAGSRAFVGYNIYRLSGGDMEIEDNWTLLNDELLTETGFVDETWQGLADGVYFWAVKAIYTADVQSMPIFSNAILKENVNGSISGFVRRGDNNQAIAGATVSVGEYSATSMASGFYSISLPVGRYSVSASHENYHSTTIDNVVVTPGESTTLNFTMTPDSNEDVVEVLVTALGANYPNPFKQETNIDIAIKSGESGSFTIYNMLGQAVYSQKMGAGITTVKWDGKDKSGARCGSGVYFYKLTTPNKTQTKKMIIMK